MGNSSKEGYTKTSLNSSTRLEVARPRKSFQLYVHKKERIAFGSVNSKAGTWAPACSLLIQEAWSNCLRLASLPSKSCSLCGPDRRYFTALFWQQTIFISHQGKQLLNGWGHLWMSVQRILRYQIVLMENPGLTISPCEVLNPVTPLPTLVGSLPFHSCLETLDHWTKPERDCQKIFWPILRKSGTLMVAVLSWMEKEEPVVSNFKTIEAKPLPPGTWAQLAELRFRGLELEKGKRVGIYTDSKYAFLVLHAHAAIWRERGHLTTHVSPIKYGDQILRLLEAVHLPTEVSEMPLRCC